MTQSPYTVVVTSIADIAGVEADGLSRETVLADLGIASLEVVVAAYEIEEAFKVDIPADELAKVKTVGDLVQGLERLIKGSPD